MMTNRLLSVMRGAPLSVCLSLSPSSRTPKPNATKGKARELERVEIKGKGQEERGGEGSFADAIIAGREMPSSFAMEPQKNV